jgi:hypothetical protein
VGADGGEGDEEKCEGYLADHAFLLGGFMGAKDPLLFGKTRRRGGMSQKTANNEEACRPRSGGK